MEYVPLIVVLALFAGAHYWGWKISQPRQSDFDAINTYAAANGLKVSKISISGNHWRYWLRGHVLLSNIARIYVINASTLDGKHQEIHVAVDPMSPGALKVLQEKSLPNR
jgi:hypothetical protein